MNGWKIVLIDASGGKFYWSGKSWENTPDAAYRFDTKSAQEERERLQERAQRFSSSDVVMLESFSRLF